MSAQRQALRNRPHVRPDQDARYANRPSAGIGRRVHRTRKDEIGPEPQPNVAPRYGSGDRESRAPGREAIDHVPGEMIAHPVDDSIELREGRFQAGSGGGLAAERGTEERGERDRSHAGNFAPCPGAGIWRRGEHPMRRGEPQASPISTDQPSGAQVVPSGWNENFWPPTLASYISPPLATVNTATPAEYLALADAPSAAATALT
jgi:hypothetical protein